MPWAKLSDTMYSDPRVLAAEHEAFGFWIRAYCYCAAHLTDGHVTHAAAMHLVGNRRKLTSLATKLVTAKLWEPHVSGDGWQIADYARDNPSRAQHDAHRAEVSEKRAAAGKAGAEVRWRRPMNPATTPSIPATLPPRHLSASWVDTEFLNGVGIDVDPPERRTSDGKEGGKANGKLP